MSSTTVEMTSDPFSFGRTIADLRQGADSAATAQAQASEKAMNTAKDFATFNQGTLEAITQACQTIAAGSQDLFRQMALASQAAFTEAASGLRALATAKTVKERLELQASLARTAAHLAVSETSRFVQASLDLAEKASAPLTARAVAAAETFTAPKA